MKIMSRGSAECRKAFTQVTAESMGRAQVTSEYRRRSDDFNGDKRRATARDIFRALTDSVE